VALLWPKATHSARIRLLLRHTQSIPAHGETRMLTRLKVTGFKNLIDTDVLFGPFTCVAGANGTGKSNLFDAIHFLSSLANSPLVEAALSVRDASGRSGDVQSLFHRVGDVYDSTMSFEAEMIVPACGSDELGQQAQATTTFLVYKLVLKYRGGNGQVGIGNLEILDEKLDYIKMSEAHKHILFPHSAEKWRKTVMSGKRRSAAFITTEGDGEARVIKLHQDGGSRGGPVKRPAASLPRTVMSTVNAAESPTAALARREMQSWRLLQLEPTALRHPDNFVSPTTVGTNGANLAATIYRLAHGGPTDDGSAYERRVYSQLANRLSELVADVKGVCIDRDEKRELLTLLVEDRAGTSLPARALSDGTLRFLALAVLESDPTATGLLCLEEPENGIHPARIAAMLRLLKDIATDPFERVGEDNPLRQVIVNTHSPAVVQQVPDDSLILAETREHVVGERRVNRVVFGCLSGTWRDTKAKMPTISKGKLLAYLNPSHSPDEEDLVAGKGKGKAKRPPRVVDREDIGPLFRGTSSK